MPGYKRKSTSAGRVYGKRRKMTPYKRKFTKRRGLGSMIKRVMLKQCETKHRTVQFENQNLNHNSIDDFKEFNPLRGLDQGTDEHQRVGDEIIGQRINYKIWLSSKLDRPNVMYRIVVYRCPKHETETNHLNIYEGVSGNKLIDYINTEKYTPVFQKFVKMSGNTALGPDDAIGNYDWTLKEQSKMITFSINLKNQKIKYEPATGFPKYQRDQYRLSILAYDAYGTLTTDVIGSYALTARVYYKDP